MIRLTRIFLILFLLLLTACTSLTDRTYSIIDQVRTKYVPDRRTDIFNVEVKAGVGKTIVLKGETTLPEAKKELFILLDAKKTGYIDSIAVLPDTVTNKRYLALATISVINLRKEPDHSAELVSQSLLGTPVMILKKGSYWSLVRTPDRYISWTESSALRPITSTELRQWNMSERMIFTDNTGWIYTATDENGIVGDIVAGCIVAKTGDVGGYARVMLPDSREGYIRNGSIAPFREFMNRPPDVAGVIRRAESYTGIPYLWGGSSVKGADCSGFVQNVFFMNGLLLSRDASQQARYGREIDISKDFSKLEPADLLFFGTSERISHVAIYKGDTEYIHSSGMVTINSLDSTRSNYSPYRRRSLVKAARIIGSEGDGIVPVLKHSLY